MIDKLQDHLPLDTDLFTPALAAKEIRQLKSKINEIVVFLNDIENTDNLKRLYCCKDGCADAP
jgi:hypothetical protein